MATPRKWTILSSEQIFKDKWFNVRKDKCETPTGKIVDPYYVYEFPTWAAAVPVTTDGKIIMIRQYRHAIGEVIMEIPGGVMEDSDTDFQEGVARELLEETGYSFSSYAYLGKISPNPSTNTNFLHMFLATGGEKIAAQKLDENEDIEVVLISIAELKELLRGNKILQAMHVTCIMYALEKLGELNY